MEKKRKIAIIDNGVTIQGIVKNEVVIEDGNIHKVELKDRYDINIPSHGTNCASIVAKYCLSAEIISVKILDENGKGTIANLQPALEWCFQNKIQLVNLSFGTTHFKDKTIIRNVINHYANKGMIIVAATANSGYKTYPASFSNIIGVISGQEYDTDKNLYWQMGVEFVAPSEHKLSINGIVITPKKSNSYAAPYIIAKIGNILTENTNYNICQIKSKMFLVNHMYVVYPDWIENAWFPSSCKISSASYYFAEKKGKYKDCKSQIDTIVLQSKEEYDLYGESDKHIVYLGEESILDRATNRYFWCKEQRKVQISCSEGREADIDIPIIIFKMDSRLDDLFWFTHLKDYFEKDGYNAFVISHRIESVLYDLEYIPSEMCNVHRKEKLHDFLYWQTYYNQTDIIIWEELSIQEEPDMLVDIFSIDEQIFADIYCDGQIKIKKKLAETESESINILYHHMVGLLTEEDNE